MQLCKSQFAHGSGKKGSKSILDISLKKTYRTKLSKILTKQHNIILHVFYKSLYLSNNLLNETFLKHFRLKHFSFITLEGKRIGLLSILISLIGMLDIVIYKQE